MTKRGTLKRRGVGTLAEPLLVTDAQAGFIHGRHCIGCWSPNQPCPIDVRFAKEQHPTTSKKYPLCVRCDADVWKRYGEQKEGA